jgi:hypothetical protein
MYKQVLSGSSRLNLDIFKEIMKMIKTNGTFNSKIAISQKPLQITITIAGIRGITVRRMLTFIA